MSCSIGINCVIEKEFTTRKIPCRYSDKIKLICLFNVLNILGTLEYILVDLTVGSCSGQDTCSCALTASIRKQF